MQKFLEFLSSPLFLNILIGGTTVIYTILKITAGFIKKDITRKALEYSAEIVDPVNNVFKDSSNSSKLERAIDMLRDKVLEKTPNGLKWLVNALLSTTVLKWAIEHTITAKKLMEKETEKAVDKVAEKVAEKLSEKEEAKTEKK